MRASREEPAIRQIQRHQTGLAWLLAVCLHGFCIILIAERSRNTEMLKPAHIIAIDLVELPMSSPDNARIEPLADVRPQPQIPDITPLLKPALSDNIPSHTPPETPRETRNRNDTPSSVLTEFPGERREDSRQNHIPSRWALKPPLASERLAGLGLLGDDIDCLRALSDDCKQLRTDIFADYALSEYEKHRAANTPWSGLGGEYYGLSEAEILEKLNVPIAGQNGLNVPILGTIIDGPLWDRMHGVNKPCKLRPGFSGQASSQPGRLTVIRDCERKDE